MQNQKEISANQMFSLYSPNENDKKKLEKQKNQSSPTVAMTKLIR